jgi:hypothetical protein
MGFLRTPKGLSKLWVDKRRGSMRKYLPPVCRGAYERKFFAITEK